MSNEAIVHELSKVFGRKILGLSTRDSTIKTLVIYLEEDFKPEEAERAKRIAQAFKPEKTLCPVVIGKIAPL